MQGISALSTAQRSQSIRINPQGSNKSFRPAVLKFSGDSFTRNQPSPIAFNGFTNIFGKLFSRSIQRLSPAASRSIKARFKVDRLVRQGYRMVEINANKFDRLFRLNESQYIAAGGKCRNAIKDRYTRFIEYLKGKDYIRPPEITMQAANINGKRVTIPFFEDGRHRFAVLRDMGMGKIPMAMSEESIKLARKAGLI